MYENVYFFVACNSVSSLAHPSRSTFRAENLTVQQNKSHHKSISSTDRPTDDHLNPLSSSLTLQGRTSGHLLFNSSILPRERYSTPNAPQIDLVTGHGIVLPKGDFMLPDWSAVRRAYSNSWRSLLLLLLPAGIPSLLDQWPGKQRDKERKLFSKF